MASPPKISKPIAGLQAAVPKQTPLQDPMGLAWEVMKSEYPEETKIATLSKMGPIMGPLLGGLGGAQAATGPRGGIKYNPQMVSPYQGENEDVLAHELTHVRQFQEMPWHEKYISLPLRMLQTPYLERPIEKEAYAVAAKRRAKRRDIPLPPGK